ncbi:hypothetical protein E2C01_016356 [Portunus trituberculatus]|uniref:Uncharacterized protein n=1 Tax=Portunus trituberculatus TaxID=210409 RepID=A0A5B7DNU3_PORTR|nr:hypothetical protein [Portunus trituberculatus]
MPDPLDRKRTRAEGGGADGAVWRGALSESWKREIEQARGGLKQLTTAHPHKRNAPGSRTTTLSCHSYNIPHPTCATLSLQLAPPLTSHEGTACQGVTTTHRMHSTRFATHPQVQTVFP